MEPIRIANILLGNNGLVSIKTSSMTMYKPSRFNAHTQTEDGTLILYNSLSGKRRAFPRHTAVKVAEYLSRKGVRDPLDKTGAYLLKHGFIVQDDTDEDSFYDVYYGTGQFRTDILQLILLSSEDCNFRCIYCSQEFKRGTMSADTRRGVKRLVEKRIRDLKTLSISWFGGEPLLGYEAIEDIAPFILEQANQHGVTLSSQITTNAYLLTEPVAERLLRWKVRSFQITIDGKAADHDKHRVLKNGGNTFDTIMTNLKSLRSFADNYKVIIRINYDKDNRDSLEMFFADLKDSFGDDQRFVVDLHPIGTWGGPNDDRLSICDDSGTSRRLRRSASAQGLNVLPLSNQLEPGMGSVCYAARPHSFVIGADGKIMKCTVVLDTLDANVVGQLDADGNLRIKQALLNKWVKPYYQSDTSCKKCFFVPVCQGAICPLPRITVGERPCPPVKTEIGQTLKDVWQEEQSHRKLNDVGAETVR